MEELLEVLSNIEGLSDDVKESIKNATQKLVDAETEKGKEFYRKKDSEAKKLRESLATREQETEAGKAKQMTLEEQIAELSKSVEEERNLRTTAENERKFSKVESTLRDALGNIINKEYAVKGMLSGVETDIRDGVSYIGDVTVEDFAKSFRESNPNTVIVEQSAGTGDGADVGSSQPTNWQSMSLAEATASAPQL